MGNEQEELPLETEVGENSKGLETVRDALKALSTAKRRLTPIAKSMETLPRMSIPSLDKVIATLRPIERILSALDSERAVLTQEWDKAVAVRREELHRHAKRANWAVKRLRDYDFVGCFQVNYRNEQVTLRLGSEVLIAFDEAHGARLFTRIQDERRKLEEFPFARSPFFHSIKAAIQLARVLERDRDGKVPIRALYPLVVLARQSLNDRFIKRAELTSFTEYPMTQFVYDLARFGRESWANRDERLRSQTPNMASIGRGATVTLPSLDGDGSGGPQIGVVWVQRA